MENPILLPAAVQPVSSGSAPAGFAERTVPKDAGAVGGGQGVDFRGQLVQQRGLALLGAHSLPRHDAGRM